MHYYKKIKNRHSALTETQRAKRNMKVSKRFMYFLKWKQRFFKVRILAYSDKFFNRVVFKEPLMLRLITFFRIMLFKYKIIKAC